MKQLIIITLANLLIFTSIFAQVPPSPNSAGSGNCLNFGGGTNIASFGNPPIWNNTFAGANKKFTISLWLNTTSLATSQIPIGKFADAVNCVAPEREIVMTIRPNGALWFGYYMNSLITYSHRHISTPAGAIPINEWIHIAVTYDGSINTNNGIDRVQIYLDGVAQIRTMGAQTGVFPGNIIAAPSPLVIGAQTRAPSIPCNATVLNGRVDELRIWNTVRTQNQIRDNMCHTLTIPQAGLVGYWTFDDDPTTSCGGTLATPMTCDLSGNGNNGTLQ